MLFINKIYDVKIWRGVRADKRSGKYIFLNDVRNFVHNIRIIDIIGKYKNNNCQLPVVNDIDNFKNGPGRI